MMKTDIEQMTIKELEQALSLEDSVLESIEAQMHAETAGKKINEKNLNLHNGILMDVITDQARAKFVWQCVTVCMAIFVVVAAFICFGLYKSRENLTEKLSVIKTLERRLAESQTQVNQLQADAIKSGTELEYAKNELDNSKTETTSLQEQLKDVTNKLENLEKRNAEAVKMLNGRLQNLSNP